MSRTSRNFFIVCLLFAFTGNWALSSVHILSWISRVSGIDPLYLLGSGAVLGPIKIRLINSFGLLLSVALVIYFLIVLRGSGVVLRALFLALTLPLLLIFPYWTRSAPLGEFSYRIHSTTLPTNDYHTIFSRPSKGSASLSSYKGFLEEVEKRYALHSIALKNSWSHIPEEKRFVLFALNFAANFYTFGNKNQDNPGGCALQNEFFGSELRSRDEEGSDFYLKSPIGCCTDYAVLLKLILDHAGYENNIVSLVVHGHTFNEVKIGDDWFTLDANIGVFYDGEWNDILLSGPPFQAFLFPVLSLQSTSPSTYRAILGPFRQKTMMVLSSGAERVKITNGPAISMDWVD